MERKNKQTNYIKKKYNSICLVVGCGGSSECFACGKCQCHHDKEIEGDII